MAKQYQVDIGTKPAQIPTNSMLGKMAFVDTLQSHPANIKSDFGAKGDGTKLDESSAIQNALYKAKHIYIPAGVFPIQNPILFPSGTSIVMDPGAVIKRNANIGNMIRNDADGVTGGYSANTDIRIRGGCFDANRFEFPSACTIAGFGHCDGVFLEGVTFKEVPSWHCVEFNAVSNGEIVGCCFQDSDLLDNAEAIQLDLMVSSPVFPWFGPYDSTPCKNITIRNNKLSNVGSGIGTHSSSIGVIHENIKVLHNTFDNVAEKCIKPLNWSKVEILGNYFNDTKFGIVATTDGTAVVGYRVLGNYFTNISKDASARAIMLSGSTATDRFLRDITVASNTVDGVSKHGIGFDYCDRIALNGNTVAGCGQVGIWFYGSANFTAAGNISKGNAGNSINIGAAGGMNTLNGTVTGNTFDKLYAQDVSRILVRNNIFDVSVTTGGTINESSIGGNLIAGVLS